MADGIGRQLVNGKDHVFGPAFRQARSIGLNLHLCAERMKRASIEPLVKYWCHATSIRGGHRRSVPWLTSRPGWLAYSYQGDASANRPRRNASDKRVLFEFSAER
jgi:hypothetical protein